MSETTTLKSDYGYSQFRVNNNDADVIDASEASWIVDNNGPQQNLYPFLVDGSVSGLQIFGGTIEGRVPLEMEWLKAYNNSAAVMVRDAPNAEIYDWTIDQAWDGIRIAANSNGFLIDNVMMTNIRDDAIENDYGAGGTVSNSMFDGVFSGLSMTKKALPNMASSEVTLENVMMRMESYLFKGNMTHQSPFKIESNSPSLKIYDTVIAIDDVNHIGQSRTELAWDKTIDASNNYFLNLSDDPLPSNYPLPDDGWTVLQGQAARDHWDKAKEDWLAENYNGHEEALTVQDIPVQDQPPPEPVVEETPPAIPAEVESTETIKLDGTPTVKDAPSEAPTEAVPETPEAAETTSEEPTPETNPPQVVEVVAEPRASVVDEPVPAEGTAATNQNAAPQEAVAEAIEAIEQEPTPDPVAATEPAEEEPTTQIDETAPAVETATPEPDAEVTGRAPLDDLSAPLPATEATAPEEQAEIEKPTVEPPPAPINPEELPKQPSANSMLEQPFDDIANIEPVSDYIDGLIDDRAFDASSIFDAEKTETEPDALTPLNGTQAEAAATGDKTSEPETEDSNNVFSMIVDLIMGLFGLEDDGDGKIAGKQTVLESQFSADEIETEIDALFIDENNLGSISDQESEEETEVSLLF